MKKSIVVLVLTSLLLFIVAGCNESSTRVRVSTYSHRPIMMGYRGFCPRPQFYCHRNPVIVHTPIVVHRPVVIHTPSVPGPHRGPMMRSGAGPQRGPEFQMRGGERGREMRGSGNGPQMRGGMRNFSRSAGK